MKTENCTRECTFLKFIRTNKGPDDPTWGEYRCQAKNLKMAEIMQDPKQSENPEKKPCVAPESRNEDGFDIKRFDNFSDNLDL